MGKQPCAIQRPRRNRTPLSPRGSCISKGESGTDRGLTASASELQTERKAGPRILIPTYGTFEDQPDQPISFGVDPAIAEDFAYLAADAYATFGVGRPGQDPVPCEQVHGKKADLPGSPTHEARRAIARRLLRRLPRHLQRIKQHGLGARHRPQTQVREMLRTRTGARSSGDGDDVAEAFLKDSVGSGRGR